MVSTRLPKIVREGRITNTEYSRRHHWVIKQLGKPMICSNCHTTESKKYDWANLSGGYKLDLSDWMRLCQSCHRKLDLAGSFDRCRSGHIRSTENTYIYPSGYRKCKICRDIALKKCKEKIKNDPQKIEKIKANRRNDYKMKKTDEKWMEHKRMLGRKAALKHYWKQRSKDV